MTSYGEPWTLAKDMKLRDYFAAQALAVVQDSATKQHQTITTDELARMAYMIADSMMKVKDEK